MKPEGEWDDLSVWLEGCEREELLHVKFLVEAQLKLLAEEPPDPSPLAGREVVERRSLGGVTLQLEKVRCGKETCRKCPHGPYWYAYWWAAGKVKSRYIGKEFSAARGFAENVQAQGRPVGGQAAAELTA